MVQHFLTKSKLPWLASPGGKGIVSDNHERYDGPFLEQKYYEKLKNNKNFKEYIENEFLGR